MRFDESIYHILGDRVEGITREQEHIRIPAATDGDRTPARGGPAH